MATNNALNLALSGSTGTGSFVGSTSATLVTPVLGAASATSLTFSSTSGIIGTTTNNNAATGSVGQYVDGGLVSAVSFVTSGTYQAMTSISLTAGDWDVSFSAQIFPTTLTTFLIGGLTTVIATPATVGSGQFYSSNGSGGYASGAAVTFSGQLRFSLSSTTTVYLSGAATYTSTAPGYYCQMTARRER